MAAGNDIRERGLHQEHGIRRDHRRGRAPTPLRTRCRCRGTPGGDCWTRRSSSHLLARTTGRISGELNQVIGTLISGQFGEYFSVSQENTGVTVTNYQFDRYCTLLSGIVKMLKSVGYRLQIKYIQREEGHPAYIKLAQPPSDRRSVAADRALSGQSPRIQRSECEKRCGIIIVCLGKGELQDRQVINLYVQENGSIGTTQYYTGLQEIAATYRGYLFRLCGAAGKGHGKATGADESHRVLDGCGQPGH